MKLLRENLTGSEMLDSLRRGHVVRRTCWVDSVYIRVTNEEEYDDEGYLIVPDKSTLYTVSTRGYFLHLGYSAQPFKNPRVYNSGGYLEVFGRDGEGIGMLFATDWEDYGFMNRADFEDFREANKDQVRADIEQSRQKALAFAQEELDNEHS